MEGACELHPRQHSWVRPAPLIALSIPLVADLARLATDRPLLPSVLPWDLCLLGGGLSVLAITYRGGMVASGSGVQGKVFPDSPRGDVLPLVAILLVYGVVRAGAAFLGSNAGVGFGETGRARAALPLAASVTVAAGVVAAWFGGAAIADMARTERRADARALLGLMGGLWLCALIDVVVGRDVPVKCIHYEFESVSEFALTGFPGFEVPRSLVVMRWGCAALLVPAAALAITSTARLLRSGDDVDRVDRHARSCIVRGTVTTALAIAAVSAGAYQILVGYGMTYSRSKVPAPLLSTLRETCFTEPVHLTSMAVAVSGLAIAVLGMRRTGSGAPRLQ